MQRCQTQFVVNHSAEFRNGYASRMSVKDRLGLWGHLTKTATMSCCGFTICQTLPALCQWWPVKQWDQSKRVCQSWSRSGLLVPLKITPKLVQLGLIVDRTIDVGL